MPRKPSEEKSPKKKPRVRFIFEPDRTSPNGITYSWLIHGTYNGKEKAATATRAFWLPFAYEATGEYSEDELKRTGSAIHLADGGSNSAFEGKVRSGGGTDQSGQ
jgi:hypothetical protein